MRNKLLHLTLYVFSPFLLIAQETINLDQCYEWAESNYPKIKQFELISSAEQYNISNIAKAWIPRITINSQLSYQSDVTEFPLDEQKLALLGFDIPNVDKEQYKVLAELNQQIWDGGRNLSQKQIARANAIVEEEQLKTELYALRDRVNQLFFGCLLYDELLRQNDFLVEHLQNNYNRIEGMVDNGVANISDLQLLEVEILQANQKKIELETSNETYRLLLSQFVGKTITQETILLLPQKEVNFSEKISRPEILAIQANKDLYDAQEKLLQSNLIPNFGLFVQGGYGKPALDMFDDSFSPYAIVGIQLSWNISNFYTHSNKRKLLSIDRNKLDITLETFLFETRLKMLNEQMEIKKLTKLKQDDEKILKLRTYVREAAEVKQENGIFSTSDLIREINAESIARQQLSIRNIQYIASIHNHLYIMGNNVE